MYAPIRGEIMEMSTEDLVCMAGGKDMRLAKAKQKKNMYDALLVSFA